MFKPKKHVRITALAQAPKVSDVKGVFEEARKARGCTVELPWRNKMTGVPYSLTVRVEVAGGDPMWTLYEGEGDASRVVWSSPFEDVELLYDVLMLSIPAEHDTSEFAGNKTQSKAGSITANNAPALPSSYYENAFLTGNEKMEFPTTPPGYLATHDDPGLMTDTPENEASKSKRASRQSNTGLSAQPAPQTSASAAAGPAALAGTSETPANAAAAGASGPSSAAGNDQAGAAGAPGAPASQNATPPYGTPMPGYPYPQGYPYPPGYPPQYPAGYYPPGYPVYPPGYYPPGYPTPPGTGGIQQSGVHQQPNLQQSGVHPQPDLQQSGLHLQPNFQQSGVHPQQMPAGVHPGIQQSGAYPQANPAKTPTSEVGKPKPNVKLGQFLLEAGLVPETTIDAALQLQELVRSGSLSTAQAAEAVRRAHIRGGAVDPKLIAAPITGVDMKALAPPLGQILVEAAIIRGPVIRQALKLQESIRSGELTKDEAIDALCLEVFGVGRKSTTNAGETNESTQSVELLRKAQLVSDFDHETASKVRDKHGGQIINILVKAGKLDQHTADGAFKCLDMIASGKLQEEKAIIALHYCQRSRVDLDSALGELGWLEPSE